MKTSYYFKLTAALLSASALTVASCSDEWKEHYEETGALSPSDQPTLFALVTTDQDLSQFARVLAHTGYDKVLASSQSLTLWAPVITKAQADSVIELYDTQKRSLITMPDGSQLHVIYYGNNILRLFQDPHGISHMGGESRKALLNGLFIADVRKDLLENGKFGTFSLLPYVPPLFR